MFTGYFGYYGQSLGSVLQGKSRKWIFVARRSSDKAIRPRVGLGFTAVKDAFIGWQHRLYERGWIVRLGPENLAAPTSCKKLLPSGL